MKIKQYAATYIIIFFVLFVGEIKETLAKSIADVYEKSI